MAGTVIASESGWIWLMGDSNKEGRVRFGETVIALLPYHRLDRGMIWCATRLIH